MIFSHADIPLLLQLVAGQYGGDHHASIGSNLTSPTAKAVSVPLGVLAVVGRHMRFGGAILICPAVQPNMGTNAILSKEYLHCIPGDAHIYLLANVLIRDGIVHLLHGDVVVRANRSDLPRRQFKRARRQRLEKRLLFLK